VNVTVNPATWTDTHIDAVLTAPASSTSYYEVQVKVNPQSSNYAYAPVPQGQSKTPSNRQIIQAATFSLTQTPSQVNLYTGDLTQTILTNALTAGGYAFSYTPVFSQGLAPNGNPNSSCQANLAFNVNAGPQQVPGQVVTAVTASPYTCSGVFNALATVYGKTATVSGSNSNAGTTVVVPPEAMIEQMLGAANGFTPAFDAGQIAQRSVSVAVLNRFADSSMFNGLTTWQAMHDYTYTIPLPTSGQPYGGCTAIDSTQQQCHVIETANIVSFPTALSQNAVNNASTVFSWAITNPGDPTLTAGASDLVGGSTCYWSPTPAQWQVVVNAMNNPIFPSGTGAPDCYAENAQIVWRTDMPANLIYGSQGPPAFLLIRRLPSSEAPSVVSYP
jgi:hypothetical protein